VTASTVLSPGTYTLAAIFTPTDTGTYSQAFKTLPVAVRSATLSIFVANATGSVTSFLSGGTVQSAPVAGGGIGLAVDSSGFVWSIDAGATSISKFTDAGVLSTSYSGLGLTSASALAIDGNGQVWIANGSQGITALTNSGSVASTTVDSTITSPNGVAVDISGNVWVSNATTNTVVEIIGGAAPVAPIAISVQTVIPGAKP